MIVELQLHHQEMWDQASVHKVQAFVTSYSLPHVSHQLAEKAAHLRGDGIQGVNRNRNYYNPY